MAGVRSERLASARYVPRRTSTNAQLREHATARAVGTQATASAFPPKCALAGRLLLCQVWLAREPARIKSCPRRAGWSAGMGGAFHPVDLLVGYHAMAGPQAWRADVTGGGVCCGPATARSDDARSTG